MAKKTPEKTKNNKAPVAIVLLAGVIVGFILLIMNTSNLAKSGVEKIATKTLGVDVSIESLDISLQDKVIEISGLRVGNPDGYKQAHAFTVETIHIAIEDMTSTLLTFDKIMVSGTVINLEVAEGNTNMTDLQQNIDRKASTKKSSSDPVKVIIKLLDIADATINPIITVAGSALSPITVPDIRITGIGQKENGTEVSEAIGQILDIFTSVTAKNAMNAGFMNGMNPDVLLGIQQSLGLTSSSPSGLMDQVKGFGGKVIKNIFGN